MFDWLAGLAQRRGKRVVIAAVAFSILPARSAPASPTASTPTAPTIPTPRA